MSCSYNVVASLKKSPGDIELTQKFSQDMVQLYLNKEYSDVTFLVEHQKLYAHRVILAARSDYFRALLYGGLAESNQSEIRLHKTPVFAFKALLRYIYSGNITLSLMKEENILDILGLSNQYGFTEIEEFISEHLRQILSLSNVCLILDCAKLYELHNLTLICHNFIDRNAKELLNHESFRQLSRESLCSLLERDSFFAPEIEIFEAVKDWTKINAQVEVQNVLAKIRLPLMSLEDLLSIVRPSQILNPDLLLDAIAEKTTSKTLHYRGALHQDENVATVKFGSKTIQGELSCYLLDGNNNKYDMEKGYTRHTINDLNDNCIMVELGEICIINHLKVLLWDRDSRSYSYFIEVSVEKNSWEKVVDHSDYFCRSWQFIYFPQRAVKYIRLVGTHNTVNRIFHVVSLEAYYVASIPELVNDLIVPSVNVATVEKSAYVMQGVSRTRNALLNGDVKNYDWDGGYTCHQLGSGEISIQLGQPYIIGSIKILLWDCDERAYSFYVETSVNQKDWVEVVDKRNEACKSWQDFVFEPIPVLFIRIIGTHNSANEIFHLVHLEAPSSTASNLKAK